MKKFEVGVAGYFGCHLTRLSPDPSMIYPILSPLLAPDSRKYSGSTPDTHRIIYSERHRTQGECI